MAPKSGKLPAAAIDSTKDNWATATWIPHTSLSQSSHMCLTIRSAHVVLDSINYLISDKLPDWRVRVRVFGIAGLQLVPLYIHTKASPLQKRTVEAETDSLALESTIPLNFLVGKATHDCRWDAFVNIPIRWRDLPRDAYLFLEVLSCGDIVEYQSTMPLFSRYGKLKGGLQKMKLSSLPPDPHQNLGLLSESRDETDDDPVWEALVRLDELERMEAKAKVALGAPDTFGQIPSVPWLDHLEKQRCKKVISEALRNNKELFLFSGENQGYLIVELPTTEIPILYEETFYPVPQRGASGAIAPVDLSASRKKLNNNLRNTDLRQFDPLTLVPFLDYENEHDNPVEDKYRTLAHDLLRGLVDPALKPDREQRNRLAHIIDSPSHHPTREEKDLLWRFRFSLVDNRRALTKFLLAVDWTVESEVVQAAELLEQWRKRSPIEVTDALKLLGKHVAFQTNLVRDYAIDTLAAAPDTELRLYLLQLVQALKYETVDAKDESNTPNGIDESTISLARTSSSQVSSLAAFLISRAAGNLELANYLYWYLKVELEDRTYGSRYRSVLNNLEDHLSKLPFSPDLLQETHADTATPFKSIVESVSKLSSSLRKVDQSLGDHRESVIKSTSRTRSMWDVLVKQDIFITGVLDIQQKCRDSRGKKDAKEAELRSLLSKEGFDRKSTREPVPLPSRPDIFVNGLRPETAQMFKSALYPALLDFNVEGILSHGEAGAVKDGHDDRFQLTHYKVIVKTGDDLRQDQLIIMMIQLMDGLLKHAALDLCLTPYAIIATSTTSGLVEFVDSAAPISQVLSKFNGSILQFFKSVAFQKSARFEVRPDVISNYIRSCAGYCVITYLLGVGDRHLDNIMLRTTGHFFHIDFGFIFGRDPKPLPPAFRLTREMVDGMGGAESTEYRQFCSLACQAFNALRKSAGLVLNLLHLMSDAGIEDLSNNPSADTEGVLASVEERFRLDLTDEKAERFFVSLINDCLAALAPRVMDVFHSISVSRR